MATNGASHRPKSRRGMTLVETMFVMGIVMVVLVLLAQTGSMAASAAQKQMRTADSLAGSRKSLEKIFQSVKVADMVLAAYPSTSSVFQSNELSTLVLRIPRCTSDGDLIAGSYDVAIFQAVSNGAPTYTKSLKRYSATILDGIETDPVFQETLATNLSDCSFGFVTEEQFFGNPYVDTFDLLATPIGSSSVVKERIMVNGADRVQDGKASFVGKSVKTYKPLNWGVPMDVTYRINPQEVVNPSGGNAATSLILRLKVKTAWTGQNGTNGMRDVVYDSRLTLLNR